MRSSLRALAVLLALAADSSGATVHKMFVTSTTGTGKLSTWGADAGGESGLAAGDKICQARAAAAGFSNASGYRAWLSSTVDDAYCRVHGLSGKRDQNSKCGQVDLPAFAGPWTIGNTSVPFGEGITELLYPNFHVYYPPSWNEFGNPIAGSFLVWTGTDFSGALDYGNCADWDSEDSSPTQGTRGEWYLSGFGWTYDGATGCDASAHLVCFESGAGDPLPPVNSWGRLAFVTSKEGQGELGEWPEEAGSATGVAAGDAICQHLADTAGLPNPTSFKAWLSDSGTDAIDHLVYDGPFIRLDRVSIARNFQDLVDQHLDSPLNLTETGVYLNHVRVWTGTTEHGVAHAYRCNDWLDATGGAFGLSGVAYTGTSFWTSDILGSGTCDDTARLYCLQDLPLVFGDGFEAGNTVVWSATVSL